MSSTIRGLDDAQVMIEQLRGLDKRIEGLSRTRRSQRFAMFVLLLLITVLSAIIVDKHHNLFEEVWDLMTKEVIDLDEFVVRPSAYSPTP